MSPMSRGPEAMPCPAHTLASAGTISSTEHRDPGQRGDDRRRVQPGQSPAERALDRRHRVRQAVGARIARARPGVPDAGCRRARAPRRGWKSRRRQPRGADRERNGHGPIVGLDQRRSKNNFRRKTGYPEGIFVTSGALGRVETELPGLPEALRRVGELILDDRPRRPGRPSSSWPSARQLDRDRDQVLPGLRLRRVRGAARGARHRDRPGRAGGLGRRASAARSGPTTRSTGARQVMAAADARRSRTPPPSSTRRSSPRWPTPSSPRRRVTAHRRSTSGNVATSIEGPPAPHRHPGLGAGDVHDGAVGRRAAGPATSRSASATGAGPARSSEALAEAGSRDATTVARHLVRPLAARRGSPTWCCTTASRETTFRLGGAVRPSTRSCSCSTCLRGGGAAHLRAHQRGVRAHVSAAESRRRGKEASE